MEGQSAFNSIKISENGLSLKPNSSSSGRGKELEESRSGGSEGLAMQKRQGGQGGGEVVVVGVIEVGVVEVGVVEVGGVVDVMESTNKSRKKMLT